MVKKLNKTKIFILSPNLDFIFSQEQLRILRGLGELHIEKQTKSFASVPGLYSGTGNKIVALDPDFCSWRMPDEVLQKTPELKAICLQTVSYAWINTKLTKQKNITITNLPGFSSRSAAEYEMLMAMNLARQIPVVAQDKWSNDFTKYPGTEMLEKTAGIIGMGNVGIHLGKICSGLGMKVIYWSRKSRNKKYRHVSLQKLFRNADFIFSAIPQNEQTKKLFPKKLLKEMKKSAIIVSIFKCALNNSPELIKLANTKKIFGYGFEQDNTNRGFISKSNVLAPPNLGWNTDNSKQRNAKQWLESIANATRGKYPTRVN